MRALVLALLLTGCASPHHEPVRTAFRLYLYESADMADNQLGRANFYHDLDTCIIALRRYPDCLLHEIRHCIEGDWHSDTPNNEDC